MTSSDLPSIGTPAEWAQFGLAGLVILALFTFMGVIVLFTLSRFRKIDERRAQEDDKRQTFLESCLNSHLEERATWRKEMFEFHREHNESLAVLTDRAVKSLDANTQAMVDLKTTVRIGKDRLNDAV